MHTEEANSKSLTRERYCDYCTQIKTCQTWLELPFKCGRSRVDSGRLQGKGVGLGLDTYSSICCIQRALQYI